MNDNPIRPQMSRGLLRRLLDADDRISDDRATATRLTSVRFSDRVRVERNRQNVGRYGDSMLGAHYGIRQVGAEIGIRRRRSGDTKDEKPQRVETNQNRPSAGFKEPTGRNYDPYA